MKNKSTTCIWDKSQNYKSLEINNLQSMRLNISKCENIVILDNRQAKKVYSYYNNNLWNSTQTYVQNAK